jgi:hypothetical protein
MDNTLTAITASTHMRIVLLCSAFADVFKEHLGLVLEREDEIGCAVGGCNFLLRTITHEAFAFEAGQAQFVPCSCECGMLRDKPQ